VVAHLREGLRELLECLERAWDITQECPDNLAEVGARYAEAGPRYGMEFHPDA
jgi:hypothetical protein